MNNVQKFWLALGASLGASLVVAQGALAVADGSVDYDILTTGLKNDAESGIEQALPIVAFIMAAVIVVGLIRKFAKAR